MLKRGLRNKKVKNFLKNKKAQERSLETLIFFLLNTIFFVTMLFFIYHAGTRAFIYEESYAKQIALIMDNAKPEMAILLDISEIIEIAEKNNKQLNEIFKLDKENNLVKVSLSERGYSYQYFSDYDADLKTDNNWLSISIKDKKIEEKVRGEGNE